MDLLYIHWFNTWLNCEKLNSVGISATIKKLIAWNCAATGDRCNLPLVGVSQPWDKIGTVPSWGWHVLSSALPIPLDVSATSQTLGKTFYDAAMRHHGIIQDVSFHRLTQKQLVLEALLCSFLIINHTLFFYTFWYIHIYIYT